MEFLRKFGEKSEAVLNACGGHHSDIPATTPYTPIIMAADAISGARLGARRESMQLYIKRPRTPRSNCVRFTQAARSP